MSNASQIDYKFQIPNFKVETEEKREMKVKRVL
jgi:hypothetical protein